MISEIAVDPAALNVWSIMRRTQFNHSSCEQKCVFVFFHSSSKNYFFFYVHNVKSPSFDIVVCYILSVLMLQIQFCYIPKLKTKHLSLCIETDLSNNLELYLHMDYSCTDQQQCNSVLCCRSLLCVLFVYISILCRFDDCMVACSLSWWWHEGNQVFIIVGCSLMLNRTNFLNLLFVAVKKRQRV